MVRKRMAVGKGHIQKGNDANELSLKKDAQMQKRHLYINTRDKHTRQSVFYMAEHIKRSQSSWTDVNITYCSISIFHCEPLPSVSPSGGTKQSAGGSGRGVTPGHLSTKRPAGSAPSASPGKMSSKPQHLSGGSTG